MFLAVATHKRKLWSSKTNSNSLSRGNQFQDLDIEFSDSKLRYCSTKTLNTHQSYKGAVTSWWIQRRGCQHIYFIAHPLSYPLKATQKFLFISCSIPKYLSPPTWKPMGTDFDTEKNQKYAYWWLRCCLVPRRVTDLLSQWDVAESPAPTVLITVART